MSQEREKRPAENTGRPEISLAGDADTSLAESTSNLLEPFGASLYADVTDMDDFIRLTIRNAAAYIDVKKHRSAVTV